MSENEPVDPDDDSLSGLDQLVADLLNLAKVPAEAIDAVGTAFEAEKGFLDGGQAQGIIDQRVPDSEQAEAVGRLIANLQPGNVEEVLDFLRKWQASDNGNREIFTDDQLSQTEGKLPRLIRLYPAVQRSMKAQVLKGITGNSAQSAHVICDLRPIFDGDRNRIEGVIPLTILRLAYQQQNGQSMELEMYLTRPLLDALVLEVQKAQKKLDVLKQTVSAWLPNGYADPS